MGKITKNNIKIKLLKSKLPKVKLITKEKVEAVSPDVVLLNETIVPKKTISKKEKYRQKHKNLMNKFSLIKKKLKEERARKNREKTAVIGDLKPLKDALPSLEDVFKLSQEKTQLKTGLKELDDKVEKKHLSAKQKIKKKKEKFIKDVESFQSILKDPEFKRNPREAIRYHIQYTHGLIEE